MKRLATATLLLTALAAGAQAGSLPKPMHLVNHVKPFHFSPYVRGEQGGGSSGGSMTAEARQSAPAPAPAPTQKPAPQPARAD
jgi:hypothetical protein